MIMVNKVVYLYGRGVDSAENNRMYTVPCDVRWDVERLDRAHFCIEVHLHVTMHEWDGCKLTTL